MNGQPTVRPTPTQEEIDRAAHGEFVVDKEYDGSGIDYETHPPDNRPQPSALTLTSLSPNSVASGAPDFVLSCIGSGFTSATVIRFGPDEDEPATLVSDTEVTTIVKPALFAPAVVPVAVHNGELWSGWINFTFTAAPEPEPES